MAQQAKATDISHSDLHTKIITPCSVEEKIALYAQWAPVYHAHTVTSGYRAPTMVANRLQKYVAEKAASMPSDTPIRVLDLGCGTGNCFRSLSELWKDEKHPLHGIGLDFSPEMLASSKKTGIYVDFVEADVSKPFEIPGGNVSFLIASGLFLDGHVSPQAIPFAFNPVEEGGVISISVRQKTFAEHNKEYINCFEEAGCVVVENELGPYYSSSETMSNYIVLRKIRNTRK